MPSVVLLLMVLLLTVTYAETANIDCRNAPCTCCKSGRCSATNQSKSLCDGCTNGFTGPSCDEPCPADCVNCSQQFYNDTHPDLVCYVCKRGFYNGKYKDMKDNVFQQDCSLKCNENCDKCSSFSDCHLCKPGYYLDKKNLCQKCTEHCERCNLSASCIACENGYGWTGEFCRQCKPGCNRCQPESFDDCSDCGSGFYSDNFQCFKCVTGCRSCDGPAKCNDCYDGFYLVNSSCSPCWDNCTLCNLDTKFQYICLSCKTGFTLYDNKCKEIECKRGFIHEGQCKPCPVSCTECSNDNNCSACVDNKYGVACRQLCPFRCLNNTCNDDDGKCSLGCYPGNWGDYCDQSHSQSNIPGWVYGLIATVVILALILLIVGLIYGFYSRCGRSSEGTPGSRSSYQSQTAKHDEEMTPLSVDGRSADRDSHNNGTDFATTASSQDDALHALQLNRLKNKYNEKKISEDFKKLQAITVGTTRNAAPEKELKILDVTFIKGLRENTYIISLEPSVKSFGKISNFFLDKKCNIIVLLADKPKTTMQPEKVYLSSPAALGNVSVDTLEFNVDNGDFHTSTHSLQEPIRNIPRKNEVTRFRLQWSGKKDYYTETSKLIKFWRLVNLSSKKFGGPMWIQCRGSIGRTGVFVAFDMLAEEVLSGGQINILDCVTRLRKQCSSMFLTKEEYRALCKAVICFSGECCQTNPQENNTYEV